MNKNRKAFTLVELLVVIAIIGILIGMLLPAVQQVREASRRISCMNQMRQVALACHNYESAHGHFPAATTFGDGGSDRLSYLVRILPFIEQNSLYNQFDLATNNKIRPNKHDLSQERLEVVLCPSAAGENVSYDTLGFTAADLYTTHYYGVRGPIGDNPSTGVEYNLCGPNAFSPPPPSCEGKIFTHGDVALDGIFGGSKSTGFRDITDGSSNTLLIGEISYADSPLATQWGNPFRIWARGGIHAYNSSCKNVKGPINSYDYDHLTTTHNNINFGSDHPGGCNFVTADGSTKFVPEVISKDVYLAWASVGGGEVEVGENF